jgi:hypothetical protein
MRFVLLRGYRGRDSWVNGKRRFETLARAQSDEEPTSDVSNNV